MSKETVTNFKRLKYWLPLAVSLALIAGMWLGYFLRGLEHGTEGRQKLQEILSLIEENYVDEVDIDTLVENSIPALLRNLDPHTTYIPADKLADANVQLKGSFGGVGIEFQIYRDTVNVVDVTPNGPAETAGIQAGDRIVSVNGKSFLAKDMDEAGVREKLRGEINTVVKLGVVRADNPGKIRYFNVTRGEIAVPAIDAAYMLDGSTGLIKVSSFSQNTYPEFLQALLSLSTEGANNFVIDLRGNTGGWLETAVLMANEFLPEGCEIVRTRGRFGQDEVVLTDGKGSFTNAGLTVLIDELSASSSEIFAGAMQDNDRALIIGRRSFGKGLVQKPFTLDDGSELRLTVQRYYTPSGRSIQKDYKSGSPDDYDMEIAKRMYHGENLNADSIRFDKKLMFKTGTGRTVYGGGGIMPDLFVPDDTTGITSYYIDVAEARLPISFAYEFVDLNRKDLSDVRDVEDLLGRLPADNVLLGSFVYYATSKGIPARWYYIKLSRNLIVSQLKALIARNLLGTRAYYETLYATDKNVLRALDAINAGKAKWPITNNKLKDSKKNNTNK